jgi:hypothetical protein
MDRPFAKWCLGILGTLFGSVVTYMFTRHSQQKHWVADNKKQEYRELLDALMEAEREVIKRRDWKGLGLDAEKIFIRVFNDMHRVLTDRIFIGKSIHEKNIYTKWNDTLEGMHRTLNVGQFRDGVEEIRALILQAAREELGI